MEFLPFVVIVFLIGLNGVFVAAEFAIIGVRLSRIEQLAEDGNRTANRVRTILRNPAQVDRYIASAQLGITLASLGLGMYGEPAIAHHIEEPLHHYFHLEGDIVHTIGFFIALGIITYLHVVVGEMVPKSIALQNAEQAVFLLILPMTIMQTAFTYPITFLNWVGVQILKLMRVAPPEEGSRLHTSDELELIISDSVVGGLLEAEEQTLIRNIFDFSKLQVGQIYTPRPKIEAISLDMTEQELIDKALELPFSRLPVYEDNLDNIVGILHLKDFFRQQVEDKPFQLKELLHQVPFVPENLQADALLTQLRREGVHMAIVSDEFGGTAGLVTLEDLLEEVVGDMRDEFDRDDPQEITVVEAGHILALGSVRLDDLREYVDLGEIATDVESIGGLLLSEIELPPQIGKEMVVNGVTLRVEAVKGLAIEKVSVRFPSNSTEE